ncbi:AsmA protein [Modicisalibacter ilicicola DSM 19980]|uniref:AsmA protein n=1 Tax=Modicisalibacter ilicicola DSM 19980 TaxID=1121942 RepID=A0A1M5EEB6_9GAMM|nr:AsmA family protein [Halomonas ilicicola]SHF77555.1 AsmA protein [Halomonas ilicicola DSM 19980]
MKGLVRTLLAVIGVLGLVVVAAVVYVTTFFDPNDLKPRLVEAVRQQSGLELALEGPLNWSFYPRLGVSVEDARAWLPRQSAEDSPFAAIDSAEVSLAFAPLLSGEIAIDGLMMDGMRLDLIRDEQGRGNWEALLERLQDESAEQALAPASAGPAMEQGEPDVALDIASVEVSNSQISYVDRGSNLDVTVRDLAISSSNVNPANAFPVESHFVVDSIAPALSSEVDLKSKVRLGLDDGRYVLEGLQLETRTDMADLPERRQTLSLNAKQVVGELKSGDYRIEGAELEGSLAHPALGDEPLPLDLSFAGEANTEQQTAQLHDLMLSSEEGLKLTGTLAFTNLLSSPSYTGQIKLAPLSLRPWLERFGSELDTADDEALSDVALTSPLKGDASQATLSNLTLIVDDNTLNGRLSVGLDGRSYRFDLQGERLNLDAYLPPVEESDAGEDTALLEPVGVATAQTEGEAGELVPVEALRDLSLDGQLSFTELKVKNLTLMRPQLVLKGGEGRLRLESFDARLYDGELNTTASLDVRETPIRWTFAPQLENVQIVPLVEDFSGEPSPLRGRLNLDGDFTSRTNALDTLLRNLNGSANFQVADGAVFDVNVSRELCTVVAMLEGETTSREWSQDTRFERLSGSVRVVDGVAHNEDLNIVIPGIELSGEGELNLPTQRFDYEARARFVDTADAACNVNPRLERVPFPVHCEGTLDGEPKTWCAFDREAFQESLSKLAQDEVKRKASERIGKELEKRLGEDAAGELGDAIRGLFK